MLSAKDMLELISKYWANVDDIMKIGSVGRNRAQLIKREIVDNCVENKKLPYGLVPMEKVIEYFDINIQYLKKVQKKETH